MFNSDYKLGCDAHKDFSLFAIRGPSGQIVDRVRINHYPVAIGATARYLAEATYWGLTKEEPYKQPPHWRSPAGISAASPSQRQART